MLGPDLVEYLPELPAFVIRSARVRTRIRSCSWRSLWFSEESRSSSDWRAVTVGLDFRSIGLADEGCHVSC